MKKSLNNLFFIVFIIAINFLFNSCNHHCEPEIFLIPDNYKGPIYIVYNQKNGVDEEYESGKRVYRLPNSGVLFTRFEIDFGIINQEYFYLTKDNRRIKLFEMDSRTFNGEKRDYKYQIKPSRKGLFILDNGRSGVMGNRNLDMYLRLLDHIMTI